MRSWTLRRDGVSLAVAEWGEPGWPPAVLAHGVGSHREFVAACYAGSLRAQRWRLVAFDLRGHARSTALADPAAHALAEHAADLAAVADDVGARVAGGISLGAHAAALLACSRPLDGLLLSLPGWLGEAPEVATTNAATADELEAVGVAGALERMAADSTAQRWVVDEVRASWTRHSPASLVAALRATAVSAAPTAAALSRVSAPTGVVGLTDDPAHPWSAAQAYAAALPHAVLAATSLAEMAADRAALGHAAITAWVQAKTRQQHG